MGRKITNFEHKLDRPDGTDGWNDGSAAAGDSATGKMLSRNKNRKSKITEVKDRTKQKYSRGTRNVSRRCPLLTLSNRTSFSVIAEILQEHKVVLMDSEKSDDDDDDDVSSNESDLNVIACGFPYYSWCNGRTKDAVLVKDACVSCAILPPYPASNEPGKSAVPSLESKLLNQIKSEYSDLSSITRKISAYTKDIIASLAMKTGRKISTVENVDETVTVERDLERHPTASQYFDESGRPCLKLRFRESRRFSAENAEKPQNFTHKDEKITHEIFSDPLRTVDATSSSDCSSASIYNYLMFARRRWSTTKESNKAESKQ